MAPNDRHRPRNPLLLVERLQRGGRRPVRTLRRTRITALPDELFAGCENLRTVALFTGSADNPPVLASIGQGAFEDCRNLESVTIPGQTVDGTYHGVTALGDRAFKGCSSLAELTVPDGVESIGDESFADVQHVYYHGSANGEPWGANEMN